MVQSGLRDLLVMEGYVNMDVRSKSVRWSLDRVAGAWAFGGHWDEELRVGRSVNIQDLVLDCTSHFSEEGPQPTYPLP